MKKGEVGKRIVPAAVGLGLLLFFSAGAVRADELSDLKQQMEAATKMMQEMQERMAQLEARQKIKEQSLTERLDNVEKKTVEIEKAAPAGLPTSASWVERIKWSGDFRYRHESIDEETTGSVRWKDGRNRHRIRARLMLEAVLNDEWGVGFRLASGSADPTSTNQTLDDSFSSKDIWLDLAYFDYHPAAVKGLNVYGGKMKNPKPNMVWFNYRRVPAAALAKQIIDDGKIGRVFHYRAKYLQDYTISADVPQGGDALWRLDAKVAGSGVTGDLLAHSIDMATWFIGPIKSVCAMTETFIKERVQQETGKKAAVTIDDACAFLARFENGALGTFESTRYACGRKNQNTFEVNGEKGSVAFDLETAHELEYFDHADPITIRGWRTIQTWDSKHPYMKNWWVPGCGIGYEHWHINTLADFVKGLDTGKKTCPDLRDALAVQYACDAVLDSAKAKAWKTIKKP